MHKILIIEDDQIVANIYRNRLSVEGFVVETAHDGKSGLEQVSLFRPDVIVLDLMLPGISGVDLLKKVRAEPDFQQVPIFVFSNTYLSSLVQEAWKAGATKCLSKSSCSPKQLIQVIRTTLAPKPMAESSASAVTEPAAVEAVLSGESDSSAATAFSSNAGEREFQEAMFREFREGLPATLAALRTMLQGLFRADSEASRLNQIHGMYQRVRTLGSGAGLVGARFISQTAEALEALLKELHDKPKNLNPSTLRTVALAVDFLGVLFEPANLELLPTAPVGILVVDDDAISRRAVLLALERAKLKAVSADSPEGALELLAANPYDLVFTDIDMPGMTGFDLCKKLRELPEHKQTPVVFVTGLSDLANRARSTMLGGTDFIGKPFMFVELAVKALVYVLRGRLARLRDSAGSEAPGRSG
jgi:DNA-binding response OmpR family regulator